MEAPKDIQAGPPKELYESTSETEAAIERIHGHFRSVRKAMADEKMSRGRMPNHAMPPIAKVIPPE
jgi:hypothetical protein